MVTVPVKKKTEFEKIMNGQIFAPVGHVTGDDDFTVKGLNGRVVLRANIQELKDAWQKTLRW